MVVYAAQGSEGSILRSNSQSKARATLAVPPCWGERERNENIKGLWKSDTIFGNTGSSFPCIVDRTQKKIHVFDSNQPHLSHARHTNRHCEEEAGKETKQASLEEREKKGTRKEKGKEKKRKECRHESPAISSSLCSCVGSRSLASSRVLSQMLNKTANKESRKNKGSQPPKQHRHSMEKPGDEDGTDRIRGCGWDRRER